MATPSRTAFRARLAGLSTDERAGFVADLTRARGWNVRIENGGAGPVVSLAREDRDHRRRLLIHDPVWLLPDPRVPGGVDAVVTWQIGRPRGIPADVEVIDADALLGAHADALRRGSYRLVVTYAEYQPSTNGTGESASVRPVHLARHGVLATRRFVAMIGPSRARMSVTERGSSYGIADPVSRLETYARGGRLYHRFPRDDTSDRMGDGPGCLVIGGTYLERALRVDTSRLVRTTATNGTRLFVLHLAGDSDPRTENVTGRLVVDDRGIVRSFTRRYAANTTVVDVPANVSAVVSLRYELGDATVEPSGGSGRPERCARPPRHSSQPRQGTIASLRDRLSDDRCRREPWMDQPPKSLLASPDVDELGPAARGPVGASRGRHAPGRSDVHR